MFKFVGFLVFSLLLETLEGGISEFDDVASQNLAKDSIPLESCIHELLPNFGNSKSFGNPLKLL